MKKSIFLLSIVLILLISLPVFSQVSINTDGSDPDPSAMLDVKSTTSGMLVPRMTLAERNAINGGTFATGLLIYQTDNTPGYYYYDGSTWQGIVGGDDGDWTISGSNMYSAVSGNVGIGTTSPSSALSIGDVGDNRCKAYVYQSSTVNGASGLRAIVASPSSSGSNSLYGVLGKAEITNGNSAFHIGVYGIAYRSSALHIGRSYGVIGYAGNCGDGWNYGVFGRLGGTQNGAAIYGTLTGDVDVNGQWAGYFNGDVYADGNLGIGTTNPGYSLDVNSGDAIAGQFDGRVIGDDAVNNDEFVTLGQLSSGDGLWTDDGAYIHPTETGTNALAITDGGNVGIGTSSPDASAKLEVSSTNAGFLPPCMTQTQMEGIASPATGLSIYNTDIYAVCYFNGTNWDCMDAQSLFDKTFFCGDVLRDFRDSQSYTTVQIGTQCWMAENLNIGTMINSTNGGTNNDGEQTDNGTIEKYCYNDNVSNCDTYGGLYQWYEIMQYVTNEGAQGICPIGWHLPTDAEWKTMEIYLGMSQAQADATEWRGTDEGGKLKEAGTSHWNSPNTGATNSSGFTGLPGGYHSTSGTFFNRNNSAHFWSSSEDGTSAWDRILNYNREQVHRSSSNQASGCSVRCVRD